MRWLRCKQRLIGFSGMGLISSTLLGTALVSGALLSPPATALVSLPESEWALQLTGSGGSLLFEDDNSLQLAHSSARLGWYSFGSSWDTELHYQLDTLLTSDSVMARFAFPTQQKQARFRLWDLNPELDLGESDLRLWQSLDRLNIRFALDSADITLGRQAISFGLARLISPSDLLTPQLASADQSGFRPGVDALRVEVPLGELTQLDLGYVAGQEFKPDNSAVYGRLRASSMGVDVELTAIWLGEHYLLSSALQGAIGEIGWWGESAWLAESELSADSGGNRYSAGFDFTLLDDLYTQLEYHHNGVGLMGDLVPYEWMSEDYLSLMAGKPVSALLNATLLSTWDLTQETVLLSGALDYSLGDESSMTLSGVYSEPLSSLQLTLRRYF